MRNKAVFENPRIGIDVVDGTAVDADGCEQARILSHPGQVGADGALLEKNGWARVPPFNASVQVVPLINPANRDLRLLRLVEICDVFISRNLTEQGKYAV